MLNYWNYKTGTAVKNEFDIRDCNHLQLAASI